MKQREKRKGRKQKKGGNKRKEIGEKIKKKKEIRKEGKGKQGKDRKIAVSYSYFFLL